VKWLFIVAALLATPYLWYEGYKEGWRQAIEAVEPVPAGRAYTPPASSPSLPL
jgi:hypothetical protein